MERGGVTLPDPFVLYRTPSGFTRWRAPVCRRGCHLPNRSKDKLRVKRGNIDSSLQGENRDTKTHKCKYFKKISASPSLLTLFNPLSLDKQDEMGFLLSQHKKLLKENWENTVVFVSLLCHIKMCTMSSVGMHPF